MIIFFKLELEMLTWKTRRLQIFDLKSKPDFFKKKKRIQLYNYIFIIIIKAYRKCNTEIVKKVISKITRTAIFLHS